MCAPKASWGSQVYNLSGLDALRLAASLLSFPGGPAGLASSSVLVGARESTRSLYFHGWNLVRGDDLKVRPIKCIPSRPRPHLQRVAVCSGMLQCVAVGWVAKCDVLSVTSISRPTGTASHNRVSSLPGGNDTYAPQIQ